MTGILFILEICFKCIKKKLVIQLTKIMHRLLYFDKYCTIMALASVINDILIK
jgi:hypothetical protein